MKILKFGLPALLVAVALSAGVAHGQDIGARRPKAPKPCYDPGGSRSCQPGPAIDVLTTGSELRSKRLGMLRLHIEPSSAEVYVDNVYAGTVRDFDGNSARVALTPGSHRVEVRAPGREPLRFDTRIRARQFTTIYHTLPAAR